MPNLTPTRAPQVLSALGPSAPVLMNLNTMMDAGAASAFLALSSDANLRVVIEACCNQPDDGGQLPAPGIWVPLAAVISVVNNGSATPGTVDTAAGGASSIAVINLPVTAVRANVTRYVAGSVTFALVQPREAVVHMVP